MTLKSVSLALVTMSLVALTLPVMAQDKSGSNIDPAATAAVAGGATTMSLARDLYVVGLAQGDALTVLAAAKLAASVSVSTGTAIALDPARIAFAEGDPESLRKTAAPSAAPAAPAPIRADTQRSAAKASFFTATSEEEGASDAPVTAGAMFAKATELAADDQAILGLIADAMAEGSRGQTGAVQWLSRLPAGQTDVWEIPFYGNSYAEIAIVGDGDTNLDVAITDENGNLFCHDVSWSDSLSCNFTPAWDGYFYITVQNPGGVRNSYHLMTN